MKTFKILFLLYVGLNFVSCASLTRSKDDAAVAKVKKVAVVAMSVFEPVPATIALGAKKSEYDRGSGITEKSPYVDSMYDELVFKLRKNMNWNVMDRAAMVADPEYKVAYDKTMKGWQNKMPPGAGQRQMVVTDVMDFDGPRILDLGGRDELMDGLGVDAIVVVRSNVVLNGTTVMGIGNRYPQTNISFFTYAKGIEKPIWFEGQIKGEEIQESLGKTGFFDQQKLGELALKSARAAFQQIGTTVK